MWEPPESPMAIDCYKVEISERYAGDVFTTYLPPDIRQHKNKTVKPDTEYTIKVFTCTSSGFSNFTETSVVTPPAMYRREGSKARFELPISEDNGQELPVWFNGHRICRSPFPGMTRLCPFNIYIHIHANRSIVELVTAFVTQKSSGCFYTYDKDESSILGGQCWVVTGAPSKPAIRSSKKSPRLGSSVMPDCVSSSGSKPDNHGLTMYYTWKVNGSVIKADRFSTLGSRLTIYPLELSDRYDRYTCITEEKAHGHSGPTSEESDEYRMSVSYSPRMNDTSMIYLDEFGQYQPVGTDGIRISEGLDFTFSIDVDGYPYPNVSLLHGQTEVAFGNRSGSGNRYDFVLENLQCKQSGIYDVVATNPISTSWNSSSRQFGLQVSCFPRSFYNLTGDIEVAGALGRITVLEDTVIANPKPSANWSAGVKSLPFIQHQDFLYIIKGEVDVTHIADFKQYQLYLCNGMHKNWSTTFRIRKKGVPDIPSGFRVENRTYDEITVEWTSRFNGGHRQYFHIYVSTVGTHQWQPFKLNISDAGKGRVMKYTLRNLITSTDYWIRLNVSNTFGFGKHSDISTSTLGTRTSSSSGWTNITLATLVIFLIITFIIALLINRMVKKSREHEQVYDDTGVNHEVQVMNNSQGFQEETFHETVHIYASVDDESDLWNMENDQNIDNVHVHASEDEEIEDLAVCSGSQAEHEISIAENPDEYINAHDTDEFIEEETEVLKVVSNYVSGYESNIAENTGDEHEYEMLEQKYETELPGF